MSSPWQKYKENVIKSKSEQIFLPSPVSLSLEKVNKDLQNTRLTLCTQCPEFIKDTSQCANCGCFMPTRTEFKEFRCPLGRWQ